MPNLTPEQLRAAIDRLAADDSENSFGDAVAQVIAHGDQRFAPLAVVQTALGAESAGVDEAAAVALLQAAQTTSTLETLIGISRLRRPPCGFF
jgi:hypothetical protein